MNEADEQTEKGAESCPKDDAAQGLFIRSNEDAVVKLMYTLTLELTQCGCMCDNFFGFVNKTKLQKLKKN